LRGDIQKGLLMTVEKLAERIRAEFDEMPGMVLTVAQASRFFGIDDNTTHTVVARLVEAAYLRWTPRGTIARAA
jgi:hypothetical protein